MRAVGGCGESPKSGSASDTERKSAHSLHVLEESLVHLEHGRLPADHLAKSGIRRNDTLRVQFLGLDVRPHRLHHLTGGHLGLARDGRQSGAERADLEDALPTGLHFQRLLLRRSDHRLALVLAAREAILLRLLLLLLFLLLLRLLLLLSLLLLRLLRLLRLLALLALAAR